MALIPFRNSLLFGFTATRQRQTPFMREIPVLLNVCEAADDVISGCQPLTPDDIAEVIVFAAGRKENVVIADSLILANHQVTPEKWKFQSIYFFSALAIRLTNLSGKRNYDSSPKLNRLLKVKVLLPFKEIIQIDVINSNIYGNTWYSP